MKNITFVSIFFLGVLCSFNSDAIDRKSFYAALSGHSEESIDREIANLGIGKKTSFSRAYLGAAQMKKADFLKAAGNKVKLFKKGAFSLEEEIKANSGNTEYRFLRLTIQENAPKILKYNKNIDEDKKAVLAGYSKLEPDLKEIIRNYAGSSKIINVDDLK
ncbi:hypothetical protein [Dyadobacter psychrotolerans]|uniref:Uncharacterized protein n=1 Tax=Dyadobacter psychrotolerans TaxID=2541721 RepID=A0A4R5DL84_9BACT|nr:hypothetical protein [Dyadobacter psychrotolerans]TDE11393.1 hypothetical protein E0F88_26150 [Dyadobacter psychrotolerans]